MQAVNDMKAFLKSLLFKIFKLLKVEKEKAIEMLTIMVNCTQQLFENTQNARSISSFASSVELFRQCHKAIFGDSRNSKVQLMAERPFGLHREDYLNQHLTKIGAQRFLNNMSFVRSFFKKELRVEIANCSILFLLLMYLMENNLLDNQLEKILSKHLQLALQKCLSEDEFDVDQLTIPYKYVSLIEYENIYRKRWSRNDDRKFLCDLLKRCIVIQRKALIKFMKNTEIILKCHYKNELILFDSNIYMDSFESIRDWLKSQRIDDFVDKLTLQNVTLMFEDNIADSNQGFCYLQSLCQESVKQALLKFKIDLSSVISNPDIISRLLFSPIPFSKTKNLTETKPLHNFIYSEEMMIKHLIVGSSLVKQNGQLPTTLKKERDKIAKFLPNKLTYGAVLFFTGIFHTRPMINELNRLEIPTRCDIISVLGKEERPSFQFEKSNCITQNGTAFKFHEEEFMQTLKILTEKRKMDKILTVSESQIESLNHGGFEKDVQMNKRNLEKVSLNGQKGNEVNQMKIWDNNQAQDDLIDCETDDSERISSRKMKLSTQSESRNEENMNEQDNFEKKKIENNSPLKDLRSFISDKTSMVNEREIEFRSENANFTLKEISQNHDFLQQLQESPYLGRIAECFISLDVDLETIENLTENEMAVLICDIKRFCAESLG